MSSDPQSFDTFLSYATLGDYRASRRVESFLEGFHSRLPASGTPVRALHVCRDGSDFRQVTGAQAQADEALWQRIRQSMATSRHLLVLCSPESAASNWVARELAWFLEHKGADHVLLAITAGADPVAHPEGVVPSAAIEAELHRSQIWYDLRQWRGEAGGRVRDAEDELVRLALDLLALPAHAQHDVATLWQREDLKRRRRLLKWATAGAVAVTAGMAVAGWQFQRARVRADEAHAASLARIADAQAGTSPLNAALVFAEMDARRAPPDALNIGYRLLDLDIPLARLRGHRYRLVAARLDAQDMALSVDAQGRLVRWGLQGQAEAADAAGATDRAVAEAVVSPDGRTVSLAFKHGEVRRVRAGEAVRHCATPADGVRRLRLASGERAALVTGYKPQAYWCDFEAAPAQQVRVISTDAALAGLWLDPDRRTAWIGVSDLGTFWRIGVADGRATQLPAAAATAQLSKAGIVQWAVEGADGRMAVRAGDGFFVGRIHDDRVDVHRLPSGALVTAASFSPDGVRLAVATADGLVTLYASHDLAVQRTLDHRVLFYRLGADREPGRSDPESIEVTQLAWSPDGQHLATLQYGHVTRLWSIAEEAVAEPRLLKGHAGAHLLQWSTDGQRLATLGDEGELVVWDARANAARHRTRVAGQLYAAAQDADSHDLAVGTGDGRILVFPDGRLDAASRMVPAAAGCVSARDPAAIAALWYAAKSATLWSVDRAGLVRMLQPAENGGLEVKGSVCAAGSHHAFDARTQAIVYLNADRRLSLADRDGVRTLDPQPLDGVPEVLRVSASGRWVAAGAGDGSVTLWDLAVSPAKRRSLRPHRDEVMCIDIDEAHGRLLSTSKDGTAVLVRLADDADTPLQWKGDDGWIESCALGNDVAIVTSESGRVWLLDPSSWEERRTLRTAAGSAHIMSVNTLRLIRAGDAVATGGLADGQVRIWHRHTRLLQAQAWMESAVVDFLEDADRGIAYVIAESGLIRQLPLSVTGLQAALRGMTQAELSVLERSVLLNETPRQAYAGYARREYSRGRRPEPAASMPDESGSR